MPSQPIQIHNKYNLMCKAFISLYLGTHISLIIKGLNSLKNFQYSFRKIHPSLFI